MRRMTLDKIASAAKGAGIAREACLSDDIVSREGYVIAARILNDKAVYNQMENPEGRLMRLKCGDVIAGVIGTRRALRGYAGDIPSALAVGERVNVLNIGGVVGRCTSFAADVGEPFEAEVLGAVLHFPRLGERVGEPAHIGLGAIPPAGPIRDSSPIVAVVGTCMNAGKTAAACEIVHGFARRGLKVGAGKVTGVALQRDVLGMRDHGAVEALSFVDAGIVTTTPSTAADAARRVIAKLNRSSPDALVIEFGDGLMGEYGIQSVLRERDIASRIAAVVLCANDPVGAWGGAAFLRSEFGLPPDVVAGPVTDNEVGIAYVRRELRVPAANALTSPEELSDYVHRKVFHGRA